MPKFEVEIPQVEYELLAKIAHGLGLDVQKLIQQETDRSIEAVSCWLQRAEMLNH
jgi:hypothetical protein